MNKENNIKECIVILENSIKKNNDDLMKLKKSRNKFIKDKFIKDYLSGIIKDIERERKNTKEALDLAKKMLKDLVDSK